MNKREVDGFLIYDFLCERCGFKSQLIISDSLDEVICPRWKCESIYKQINQDLIYTGKVENPFF